MGARNGFVELGTPTEGLRAAPIVSETYWGYVIRPSEPYLERAALIEMLATFSGILVFLSAYGQWLLPGADLSRDLMPLKLVITVVFAVLGATLVWIGRMGMVQELHVDRSKSELRLVQRNRHGHGRMAGRIGFEDIASVIIASPRLPMATARLSLRLTSGDHVDLLPCDPDQLLPIRDRLIVDVAPQQFQPHAAEARPARRRRRATA
jgi:hypothetical protein